MISSTPKKMNLLTVLVEDYFHVGAFENLIRRQNWAHFEPRFEHNTRKTLDLLDELETRATFFVLGWIAERNPRLVREIASRGHEVASRGFYHRSLNNLTFDEFRDDLHRTNAVIEDATGRKVIGYRSAEKLRYSKDSWIFEILSEEGFAYDASFVPSKRDDAAQRFAHQVHAGGRAVWEFPYSTANLGVGLFPVAGGNYFRQIPYTLTRFAVRDLIERGTHPFVMYFHVWELDAEQPRISAASAYNRVRHYRKLDKMEWIIKENLRKYDFTTAADYLGLQPETAVQKAGPQPEAVEVKGGATPSSESVTIVLPCYNEESALPYLANTLKSVESSLRGAGYDPNFIFVDDSSTDTTFAKIGELFGDRENVRVLRHETNQGVAAGIQTGIRAATTEIVCSMDCDCTYDPHELVRMIPMLTGNVDLVTASPYHREGGVRNVPEWRLFLSKGASWLYRRTLRSKLDTYTSCFRVYRRASVVDLPIEEKGFLGVAEMLGRLDLAGGRIVEYPTVLEVRLFGFSKMKTARTIAGHLRLLGRLARIRVNSKKPALKKAPLEEISEQTVKTRSK